MPALRQDRLRVELHAFDRPVAMPQRHHHAARRAPCDGQLGRQRVGLDGQRVVAGGREGRRQAVQHAGAFVLDLAGLAVQQLGGAADGRAVGDGDGLVPEAHAEQRHAEVLAGTDHLDADTGVLGRPGPG